MDWVPTGIGDGPFYLRIVDELASDIVAGKVRPGTRLPPQRVMAERLDLSVGTVSKAYAEAERRGLIYGEVGRGTFVSRGGHKSTQSANAPASINLAVNVPPPTGAEEAIAKVLAEIASEPTVGELMAYLPHQGLPEHRRAIAGWLNAQGIAASEDGIFVTSGAQHAIAMSLIMLAGRGDTVLAEAVTYSGMQALAAHAGIRLLGVEMDREGVMPDALDRAFAASGARVFYTMPTLQTPTGIVTSIERRREIAAVLARHDAYVIEDDTYAFLFETAPLPISQIIPERGFYVVSFAKCLAPGLRIGALQVPDAFRDRTINALRATGWMAPPIMAEAVTRLIHNGGLDRQVALKRETAAKRYEIAKSILGARLRFEQRNPGFHVWVGLPEGRSVTTIAADAAVAGLSVAGPAPLLSLEPAMAGLRLCIGAPKTEPELKRALGVVAEILDNIGSLSVV